MTARFHLVPPPHFSFPSDASGIALVVFDSSLKLMPAWEWDQYVCVCQVLSLQHYLPQLKVTLSGSSVSCPPPLPAADGDECLG